MLIMYAFRPALGFSSGIYSLKTSKQDLLTVVCGIDVQKGVTATPIFTRLEIITHHISAAEGRIEPIFSLK